MGVGGARGGGVIGERGDGRVCYVCGCGGCGGEGSGGVCES